jgi:hypothetical protein
LRAGGRDDPIPCNSCRRLHNRPGWQFCEVRRERISVSLCTPFPHILPACHAVDAYCSVPPARMCATGSARLLPCLNAVKVPIVPRFRNYATEFWNILWFAGGFKSLRTPIFPVFPNITCVEKGQKSSSASASLRGTGRASGTPAGEGPRLRALPCLPPPLGDSPGLGEPRPRWASPTSKRLLTFAAVRRALPPPPCVRQQADAPQSKGMRFMQVPATRAAIVQFGLHHGRTIAQPISAPSCRGSCRGRV